MICKYCDSTKIVKNGKVKGEQQYLCKVCGHQFIEGSDFPKMRTESRIISTSIDLYFEGLSVRKVQTQIAKIFGVEVSQVTIWKWIMKYSSLVSDFVVTLTPKLISEWHVDETAIKCKGVQKWFWEIIDDRTKFLVASHLSGDRTIKDVVSLFEKGMAVTKRKPTTVYVDGLPAYEKGFNKVFWTRYKKDKIQLVKKVGIKSRVTNNIVERLHGTLKDRTRVTRGLKEEPTVDVLLKGWTVHYDYVRPHQSLNGITPAQASGIEVKPDWHELITSATTHQAQMEIAYKNNGSQQNDVEQPIAVMAK